VRSSYLVSLAVGVGADERPALHLGVMLRVLPAADSHSNLKTNSEH
jgi:hypothetical protein